MRAKTWPLKLGDCNPKFFITISAHVYQLVGEVRECDGRLESQKRAPVAGESASIHA
jgi:chromosome condensin MukBEF MukE localization factor